MIWFVKLLPLLLITKFFGLLAAWNPPKIVLLPFLKFYSAYYSVNLEEAAKPLEDFNSFNEFFTRKLKASSRMIDLSPKSIISPVDGVISQSGLINVNKLMQVKGQDYALEDLIGADHAPAFVNGAFQTIYLSPADYHRIHLPFDSKILEVKYFSGNLYPVNNWAVNNVKNLFCVNERVLIILEHGGKKYGMVLVGALIVGSIDLTLFGIKTIKNGREQRYQIEDHGLLQKALEIAQFKLGSTVIMLYPPDAVTINEGLQRVKLGEQIGLFK